MKIHWELDFGDILGGIGIIFAFCLSLVVARCSVDWQSAKTEKLETDLKYAEMVTALYDEVNTCQVGIASLRGKQFDVKLALAEGVLIKCRGNLSKIRAGFGVLSQRMGADGASEIHGKLKAFDLILLARIQEIQSAGSGDKLEFQTAMADKISALINRENGEGVDLTEIKSLADK